MLQSDRLARTVSAWLSEVSSQVLGLAYHPHLDASGLSYISKLKE